MKVYKQILDDITEEKIHGCMWKEGDVELFNSKYFFEGDELSFTNRLKQSEVLLFERIGQLDAGEIEGFEKDFEQGAPRLDLPFDNVWIEHINGALFGLEGARMDGLLIEEVDDGIYRYAITNHSLDEKSIFVSKYLKLLEHYATTYPQEKLARAMSNGELPEFILRSENEQLFGGPAIKLMKDKITVVTSGIINLDEIRNGKNYVRFENGHFKFSTQEGNPDVMAYLMALMALRQLGRKHYEGTREETVAVKHITKKGKTKRKKHIKNVTYILPPTKKSYRLMGERKDVEWTHQFKRRGHWRRIAPNKFGKNRHGDYSILGETWVIPSTINKDKDLPFIEKTRVILSEKDT